MILRTALVFLFIATALSAQELQRKPFLGVIVQPLPPDIRENSGVPEGTGVFVQTVLDNSSARDAGLQQGDIITAVAGTPVTHVQQFLSLLGGLRTGDNTEFTLYREKKRMSQPVLMKARPQEQYPDVEVAYGEVRSQDNLLRTIFTRPKAASGRLPAVFLIQGVDCGSIDLPFSTDNVYARFIQYFSQKGFATFRVEKSGVGDSRGTPCAEMDFDAETRGFIDGLKALKSRNDVHTDEIYIVGLSLGGITAPILASQSEVKGIVVYGTVLRPWAEYMLENTRRQSLLAGEDYADVELRSEAMAQALHYIFAEGQSPADVSAARPGLADIVAYLTGGSPQGRPEFIAGRHYTFMRQLHTINISEYWKNVKANVLVVWGRGDFISDPDDHSLIAELVNNYRPGRATYAEINADHWLGTARDTREAFRNMGGPKPQFNEEILALIGNWMERIN